MDRRSFTFGLLGLSACASAGSAASAAPGDAVERELTAIRKRHSLPALGTAVIREGRTVSVQAVGVRKSGDPTPVTAADQFHIGSCTKSMTATLVGMLVEEEKLRWDSALSEVFPDLREEMHPELRPVTLEQLLCHRGGLSGESWPEGKGFLDMHRLPGPPVEQRKQYVRLILKQKPALQPGTGFQYSNAGFAIAGAAAERVAGAPWEELMRKRLFQPLGIRSAGFGAMGTPGKVDQPWQHARRNGRWEPVEPGPLSDNPAVIGPGGTAHLSLDDWARYVSAHLQGARSGARLLKPATWKKLHTPLSGSDYAFGWGTTAREWGGGTVLTHNGTNTMNFAVVWMAPRKNFAVMAVTNQGGERAEQACDEVASAMIGQFLPD